MARSREHSDEHGAGRSTIATGVWSEGATVATLDGGSAGATRVPDADESVARPPGAPPERTARYEDLGVLGTGAMGEVRKVRDRELNTVLAMKIMRPELAANQALRRRFLQETHITAQLRHPSVVAVQNRGELPDGRLWFTMTMVEGHSLREILRRMGTVAGPRGLARTPCGWSLQRLLQAFARICATIGFAHARGIIHRDIKPPNMMLGDYGEVMVMDWGVARKVGHTDHHGPLGGVSVSVEGTGTSAGQLIGTPVYMAPEQFGADPERVGPPADVWGLGAMLYELLTGRPPYFSRRAAQAQGPILPVESTRDNSLPEGIPEICARMLQADPAARPGAAEVAEALQAWLDGSARRDEARRMVEAAAGLRDARDAQLVRAREARCAAHGARADLGRVEGLHRLRPVWAAEAAAEAAQERLDELDRKLEDTYRAASRLAPDAPAPREALVGLLEARFHRLRAAGEGPRLRETSDRLAALAPARHRALVDDRAWLSIDSRPRGATVQAWRYVEQDGQLLPRLYGVLGTTPLREHRLPAGSWRLTLAAPGHRPAHLPVLLEPGRHHELRRPRDGMPVPVPLLRGGTTPPTVAYVPPGFFIAGADPLAVDSLPRVRLWTDGFLIRRTLVAQREIQAWLQHLVDRGDTAAFARHVPREDLERPRWAVVDGRVVRRPMPRGGNSPDHPTAGLTLAGATAFAAWAGRRDGLHWGVPHDLLWERAVRGADGRTFPWGDRFEPVFSNNGITSRGRAQVAVDIPLRDVGPHGLVGAAGIERELCSSGYRRTPPRDTAVLGLGPLPDEDLDWVMVRGGSHQSQPHYLRLAGRFAGARNLIVPWAGLRLAAPVPWAATPSRRGLLDPPR